jgi:hypothetical protein
MTVDELSRMTSDEVLDLLERIGHGWMTSIRGANVLLNRILTPGQVSRFIAWNSLGQKEVGSTVKEGQEEGFVSEWDQDWG